MKHSLRAAFAALTVCLVPTAARAQNAAQDVNFVIANCGLWQGDVSVIPRLWTAVQKRITAARILSFSQVRADHTVASCRMELRAPYP